MLSRSWPDRDPADRHVYQVWIVAGNTRLDAVEVRFRAQVTRLATHRIIEEVRRSRAEMTASRRPLLAPPHGDASA